MSVSQARVGRGIIGFVLLALVVAACSAGATTPPASSAVAASATPVAASPSPAAAATSPAATSGGGRYGGGGSSGGGSPAASLVINLATTSLGPVLIGPNGLTLYTHSGDTATSSSCTGGCATAWPPLSVTAGAQATGGTGVTGTLGTLTRADGTNQITYNGMPLYGWQSDSKPGDVTGQGINGFAVAKP